MNTQPKLWRSLLPSMLLVAAIGLGVGFRGKLAAWFTLKPTTSGAPAASASAAPAKQARRYAEPLPKQELPEPALTSLRTAFEVYEELRAALAKDSLEGVPPRGKRTSAALRAASSALEAAPAPTKARALAGADAADQLGSATDLEAARDAFSKLSEALVSFAAADPRLAEGRHVFECPMTRGFNKWVQVKPGLENPYMGPSMLVCGSESRWESPKPSAASEPATPGKVAFYTCPMHPSIKQHDPGKCPICGMDLTPVTEEEVKTGVVVVDGARRQLIGVKTALVEKRTLERKVRAVGKIAYDESRLHDVTLKFKGWIEKLAAASVGKRVRRGETLFSVYSPEVFAAQNELLLALNARRGLGDAGVGGRSDTLVQAARLKLELWDVPKGLLDRVEQKNEPVKYVSIASPAAGFIVEKNVVEGSAVEPGMRLFRIANLDKVWIEAELYEAEIPLVTVGQSADISLSYLPERRFTGKVSFVYPYLDAATRTGRVRIELDNEQIELKPDMYANVELPLSRGEKLVVPESAVIYSGPRRVVFVDIGDDRLKPREIKIGLKSGDYYEVLEGLSEGDRVVTGGNFLIAADSRLKSAAGQW